MHRRPILFLAAAAALISACAAKTPAIQTPAATASLPAAGSTASPAASECTVVSLVPTPGPTEVSMFPPAKDGDWVQGPADASVTFLEYSDFQ